MLFLTRDRGLCLAYSPDSVRVAVGCVGGLLLWNRSTPKEPTFLSSKDRVNAVAFSPDGRWLATAVQRSINLFDLTKGNNEPVRFSRHRRWIWCLAFSPDSRYLVSGSGGKTAELFQGGEANLWDLRRWRGKRPLFRTALDESRCGFCSVAFVSRRQILLGDRNREIILWEVREGEYSTEFTQRAVVNSLALTADGSLLATTAGWTVHLWSLKDSCFLAKLAGHKKRVWSVAFAPDGRTLLSGSGDSTVRLWDVEARRERCCFDWGIGSVTAVAFAPDGMTAAAAGNDGTVIWDVEM